MRKDPNRKPWESAYANPIFRENAAMGQHWREDNPNYMLRRHQASMENEDETFIEHRLMEHAVIIDTDDDQRWRTDYFRKYPEFAAFLKKHRLQVINSGWTRKGYAVNFKDSRSAVLFRVLYEGRTFVPEKV